MFALRKLIEKCHEQHQQLHLIFVDLVKAFDTVNRQLFWSLLAKIGIPTKIINIIKSFHDGMNAKVSIGGELKDSFEVSSGLRQGCIMAPALFILVFAFVLRKSHQLIPDFGIDIRHKLDGRLFNLRRLKAKSATTMRLSDFLYADDAAHGTTSPDSLQNAATALNTTCKEWGLITSKPKTEVMHINCDDPPPICIDEFELKRANKLAYLGGDIADNGSLVPEIKKRISRAAYTFRSLASRCWDRTGLSINTKLIVYKAIVLPTLLYGSETWPSLARQVRMLEAFHQRSLPRLLKIRWWRHITNTEVLVRAKCTTI